MGYDLHITRAPEWAENRGNEIEVDEWLAIAQDDPELNLDPKHGPYAVSWTSGVSAESGWFDWYDGNVFTTDPGKATVDKMLNLATRMAGVVQGDEGELYQSAEQWSTLR